MDRALTFTQTTIGKKVLVALTGAVLFGFVLGHLVGNLQIFLGPEKINAYGAMLHSMPALLWGARIVLLVSLVTHVTMIFSLRDLNGKATGDAYQSRYKNWKPQRTNTAALYMIFSGITILLYVVYHLLHLTIGKAPLAPQFLYTTVDGHEVANVYDNLVYGFQNPIIAGFYVLANLALGAHLFHGARAMFRTLGVDHNRYNKGLDFVAYGLAAFITIGNVAIPAACLVGLVKPSVELEANHADPQTVPHAEGE